MPHPNTDHYRSILVKALCKRMPEYPERSIRNWLKSGGPRDPHARKAWDRAHAKAIAEVASGDAQAVMPTNSAEPVGAGAHTTGAAVQSPSTVES